MNLSQLMDCIRDFEIAAFEVSKAALTERKKKMRFAAQICPDRNISAILGGSIDYLSRHPEWVREAIWKARDCVETLRANSVDRRKCAATASARDRSAAG